jgi:transcription termination factor Rho
MSVEATALSRSKLEQKDRAELAAIVEAMGGKAGSRAKKADLVDQVLELAGAGNGSSAATPATATTATTAATGSVETGNDLAVRSAERTAVGTPPAAPALDEEPLADWELAVAAEVEAGAANGDSTANGDATANGDSTSDTAAPRAGSSERGNDHEVRHDDSEEPRAAEGEDQGQGSSQGAHSQGQGSAQGGQGQGQGGQRDDGESGNRRRRRRGRDRDRGHGGDRQGPQQESDAPFLGEPVDVEGYLDLRDEGYGFLRLKGFLPSKDDVYVSVKQARQFGLRKGDFLKGAARPASRNEKNPALLRIDTVNDIDPEQARNRRRFEDLTPLFPDEKLKMELADDPGNMTNRIIDLISPIGKGQRGLIVSPPKAGKTTIMKNIARAVEINNPEVHLIVLLVDERPEEVTDMKRWLLRGEVAASTFDRPSDEHTVVAELTIERAKRMVETGKDVVIILDGITRLARAYNLAAPASGRIMSGGIDAGALYPPKKFFGAARNIEEGGSLTILATALVETGSRMDDHIFEEFKGTGNMELRLDRKLAERRIYPAIDVDASSTRHEELLFARNQLNMVWKLRRVLSGLAGGEGEGRGNNGAGLELLIDRMKTFKSNDEFLAEIAKAPSISG